MPEPSLTPEEKLLRIIESSPGKIPTAARVARKRADIKFTFKDLKNRYTEKFSKFLNIKSVNILLVFLSAGFSLFVIIDFLAGLPRMTNVMRLESDAKKQGIGDVKVEHLQPLAYYLQEITGGNIFDLPVPQAVSQEPEPEPLPQELTSLAENLSLVGIIWSKPPQAIIEDKTDGKTYLVNRGSKVKIARVKEILKDKVVLSYDKQEIELK
ncbi:MAG: hypothetical protein ABIC68_03000 [Candidatus Omnitrophota bacterium]